MYEYQESGLYIGKYCDDYFVYAIEIHDDMTWREYEAYMNRPVIAQPLSGRQPPVQILYPLLVEQPRLLAIDDESLNSNRDFIAWMGWSFDWSLLYRRWYAKRLYSTLDYVIMFNDEVRLQWEAVCEQTPDLFVNGAK